VTSVEVIRAERMQPRDLFAGIIDPAAPTTPVQTWARALRLTAVTPYDGEGGQRMLSLQAGSLTLTPVPAVAQVLVTRDDAPDGYREGGKNPEGLDPRFRVVVTDTDTGQTALVYVPAESFRDAALTAAETPEAAWAEHPESLPSVPGRAVRGKGEQS
jgi:hypothetical protein